MNKPAVILCFLFAIIIACLLFTDNQEYSVDEIRYDELGNEVLSLDWMRHLRDQLGLNFQSFFVVVIFCFPYLLVIESTFFPKMRRGWWRLIFVVQAALLGWMALMILVLMAFKLFADIHVFITFYLILLYFGLGVLWNLLLGIPFLENKYIQKSFDILSLKRKNTNE